MNEFITIREHNFYIQQKSLEKAQIRYDELERYQDDDITIAEMQRLSDLYLIIE